MVEAGDGQMRRGPQPEATPDAPRIESTSSLGPLPSDGARNFA